MAYSIFELLQIPNSLNLKACVVADFIFNRSWSIPSFISEKFPDVVSMIHQLVIPIMPCENKPVCRKSESSILTFRDAYQWFKPNFNSCSLGNWFGRNTFLHQDLSLFGGFFIIEFQQMMNSKGEAV